jgi:transposase InsO family protein
MTFVAAHRDRFGVEPILRVLDIAVSTFYGWVAQQRDPSKRRRDDQALANRIRRIHHRSGQTYGAPRVHAQLRRDGIWVSRKRVARLLRAHGLQGAFLRKRWRCSTRQDPTATPAPDLVNRDFKAAAPNRLWVADISRIPTGEGPLWLACVRDAFSRRIVGWKASDRADVELVLGRWRTPCGAAWMTTLPSAGSSSTRTGARSTPLSGSPSAWPTLASSPRWARSATASITPWPRTSSPP